MKKAFFFIAVAYLFLVLIYPKSAFADEWEYTDGVLDWVHCTDKLCDNDLTTAISLNPGAYKTVNFGREFNITSFYLNGTIWMNGLIKFFDKDGDLIKSLKTSKEGYEDIDVVKGVWSVQIINDTDTYYRPLYEIDFYDGTSDHTPPSDISVISDMVDDTTATFTWVNPTDSDFDHVSIDIDGETLATNKTSFTFKDLAPGSSHTVTFYAVDKSGNKSSGITKTFTTTNTIPPGEVTDISESHDYQSFSLTFDNPKDADFDHANIYINGEFDGSAVYGDYLKSGLKPLTTYNVKITTVDSAGNESDGVTITIKTDDAPIPGISGATITKNKDGDYVLSWENDDITGTADIYIGGKKWGSTDVNSSPITIPNEDIKETLTGIEVVKVVPVSVSGKSPPYDKVPPAVYKGGVKEQMKQFITAWGILKSVFGFISVLSGIILLALAVHFSKPIMEAIKRSIRGMRR